MECLQPQRETSHLSLEQKWLSRWEEKQCFSSQQCTLSKKKFYNFDSAPFPNGDLHLGHVRNYLLGDVIARHKRQQGFSVLYATNFDAFGLPNELAAEREGCGAGCLTESHIGQMTQTLRSLGVSYDWAQVKQTNDPTYYKWTQWLFLQLFKAGFVYRAEALLPWCPSCNTALALMQVENGLCWRCETRVVAKTLPQWFIKTSIASEELLDTIESLTEWSPRARHLLASYNAKRSGTLVPVNIIGADQIYGATNVFLPDGESITAANFVGVAADGPVLTQLLEAVHRESEITLKQTIEAIARTVVLGKHTRRSRQQPDSMIDADLIDTGIRVMCKGAVKELPVFAVGWLSHRAENYPRFFSSLPRATESGLREPIPENVPKQMSHAGIGHGKQCNDKPSFHIRDWAVSRNRRWGTPIPILHCDRCGVVPIPEEDLPLLLDDYHLKATDGENASSFGTCPKCQCPARRDADTLDCYFDDSWCFVSGAASNLNKNPFLDKNVAAWLPADEYHAGFDIHTYLHVYRFMGWFLHKQGWLKSPELINKHRGHDLILQNGSKMSKRHMNAITASQLLEQYGSDTIRVAVLMAANPEKPIQWQDGLIYPAEQLIALFFRVVSEIAALDSGKKTAINGKNILSNQQRKRLHASSEKDLERVSLYVDDYKPRSAIGIIRSGLQRLDVVLRLRNECGLFGHADMACLKSCALKFTKAFSLFAPFHSEEAWELLNGEGFASTAIWTKAN